MTKAGQKTEKSYDGRRLALEALIRVERDGAYANRVLHALFLRTNPPSSHRSDATDWVYGTLRHRTRIDHYLSQLLKNPLEQLKPAIRNLLRLAVYQLDIAADPPYAVVDQAVRLAKVYGHEGVARLVNGVLRSFLRESTKLDMPSFETNPMLHMVIAHSHPEWLVRSWMDALGVDRTHALVALNNTPAPLYLRVNPLRTKRQQIMDELTAAEIPCEESVVLPEAIRLLRGTALESFRPLVEGDALIQDLGAMLISHLLNPKSGETIVDLCAAPGGKTTHLAELMLNQGKIWAIDQYAEKSKRIKESAERLGLTIIESITHDGREFRPEKPADAVLLDAPCSGTGVIRRRPDLRWRRQPTDLQELVELQRGLLSSAAEMIRPGGRLVYSTCSLQTQENEEQTQWFLKNFPRYRRKEEPYFFKEALTHGELEKLISPEGILLLPSDGNDGFYMTLFERMD